MQFATKGSEVYTTGMCKMIADLTQAYTRLLLSSTSETPSKQMAHQMELRIDAQNANTSAGESWQLQMESEDVESVAGQLRGRPHMDRSRCVSELDAA